MFGQTKRTGEANMYPKPIQDLSGWEIRCVACSQTSVVVAADDSVIAWGASPTFGELVRCGYFIMLQFKSNLVILQSYISLVRFINFISCNVYGKGM